MSLRSTFKRLSVVAALVSLVPLAAVAAEPVTLTGASAYDANHIYNKTLERFASLVKQYYPGGEVKFVLHPNGELGEEADTFRIMSAGTSIDYGIVAVEHMTPYSKKAGFLGAPFLFKSIDAWKKAITEGDLQPIIDDVQTRAKVKILGLAGGESRNIISKKDITKLADLKDLRMRVQNDKVQQKAFSALGIRPALVAYLEIYNAIQSGVIDALENEPSTMAQMKFYEVAPNIYLTRHIITVRPLVFNKKTYDSLPPDLQKAIDRAGAEATAYGRELSLTESDGILKSLADQGKLKAIPITPADLKLMQDTVRPVVEDYAKSLGVEDVYQKLQTLD